MRNEAGKSEPTNSPYEVYKGTAVWNAINKAIDDLVENDDLVEKTRRDYIVGFICLKLQEVLSKADA
jgi:hypothetical protein